MNKILNKVIDVFSGLNTIDYGILHAWITIIGTIVFIVMTKLCVTFGIHLSFVLFGTAAILIAFYSAYELRNFEGFHLR